MSRNRPAQPWIELLTRLTVAGSLGRELDIADVETLQRAILAAVETRRSLETCLGFPPQWRSTWRRMNREASIARLAMHAGGRAAAADLHRRLTRYRASARFATDLSGATRPQGDDWYLHAVIRNNGGRVPSIATIRRWLNLSPWD